MQTSDRSQGLSWPSAVAGTLAVGMYTCGCRVFPQVHDSGCHRRGLGQGHASAQMEGLAAGGYSGAGQ